MIQGTVTIGASGAVSSSTGTGVSGVTKLTTGIYQIQTIENYNGYIGSFFEKQSPAIGSNVNDGSFVTNTLYQITAVGTTDWHAAGLNSGLTAAVGQTFVATGAGGAGTGTAKAVGSTGIGVIEVPYNPQQMLDNSTINKGAIIQFQTFGNASTISFTGDTTNTSTTIANVSSTAGLVVGQSISGAGIPLGATIATIASATSITISAAATATASTVPMTATPGTILASPTSGTVIGFCLFFRNSSNSY